MKKKRLFSHHVLREGTLRCGDSDGIRCDDDEEEEEATLRC